MKKINATPVTVYTVGHSTHSMDRLIEILKSNEISEVVDVRSQPYSRFQPQFNRSDIEGPLRAAGIGYLFLGQELGARSNDTSCYVNGRVQYQRIAATKGFERGIDRVLIESGSNKLALMCAEKEPLECHRTLLVGQALFSQGVSVVHIHSDGRQENHSDALIRLHGMVGLPLEDLFRTSEELLSEALRIQEERVAYVDEKLERESK
ncbi:MULTISPECIES: DUF488 family protein [unclassified Polaromonas]|uniref:DUF488 domain-containing protein n=1 Tax=unclassified Polaromonas TaxID=2638319 RepID=UPI0018CBC395|nr:MULTISPECIES: DUF488 domain-containing protein [unclassified Polaromonas]MBG6073432.1 uncharacterized protein (DUF488 family) [Polaromonas sp. CG_9.7]MBG6115383.1 uncharacterized protein (DUF488 family) [Polaromonas sp. CG_9.2]